MSRTHEETVFEKRPEALTRDSSEGVCPCLWVSGDTANPECTNPLPLKQKITFLTGPSCPAEPTGAVAIHVVTDATILAGTSQVAVGAILSLGTHYRELTKFEKTQKTSIPRKGWRLQGINTNTYSPHVSQVIGVSLGWWDTTPWLLSVSAKHSVLT